MLSATAHACLAEAVEDTVAHWELLRGDALSPAEVEAAAREIATRITATAAVGVVDPAPREAIVTPLARRCLAVLRRRVMHSPHLLPADELLPLLRAIEAVSEAFEPQWAGRFHDRMTGPNGLELVVEVAHDLRSPLTSILFLAETMLRGRSGPLTTLQERQLGLVYSAAFGLNAVASDVIELVRGGDRLADLARVQFSVAEALESVEQIVLPLAEEKGLALRIERPQHDLRIGHPAALGRVLLNLTTNALKFTGSGEVVVAVQERADDLSRLHIAVRDTGHGIPEGAMATLFEPFRRRQQAGDYAFSGTGLGLSICRKLVEGMGAQLELETVHGQGTTFWFEIDAPVASEGLLRDG